MGAAVQIADQLGINPSANGGLATCCTLRSFVVIIMCRCADLTHCWQKVTLPFIHAQVLSMLPGAESSAGSSSAAAGLGSGTSVSTFTSGGGTATASSSSNGNTQTSQSTDGVTTVSSGGESSTLDLSIGSEAWDCSLHSGGAAAKDAPVDAAGHAHTDFGGDQLSHACLQHGLQALLACEPDQA